MSRASTTAENNALTGMKPSMGYLSGHSADPGVTGASETTGGGYARQALANSTPATGQMSNTGSISMPIAAGVTIPYVGTYDAVTAGNYQIGAALTASVTFGSAGNLTFAPAAVSWTAS